MIYSRSSYKFIELRIRIQPILLSMFGNYENTKFNQNKNLLTICIFLFIIQSCSTHSPEFTGLKLFFVLFICSFIFCWIRIQTIIPDPGKSSGSGSTTLIKTLCLSVCFWNSHTVHNSFWNLNQKSHILLTFQESVVQFWKIYEYFDFMVAVFCSILIFIQLYICTVYWVSI